MVRLGIRVSLGLDMILRVLMFEVEFWLQTSYKMADHFHMYKEISVDKTFVKSGLVVPWKTPIEI